MLFITIILVLSYFNTPIHSLSSDFNLIWFEANDTEPYYYTARHKVTKSLENAAKIVLNQKISVLRSFDLNFAKNARTLIMDNCGLNDIEPESFKDLPPLIDISVTRNNLKVIKEGVFNYVDVIHLNLSHNKLTTIDPSAFDDMHNLKSIILDHNELTVYEFWFENCPNITTISVMFNSIQYLPEGMFKAINNHKLSIYLSHNKIKRIHPDAFLVREFGDFCLDHNEIEELDHRLTKINNFDLHENHIRCLSNKFLTDEVTKVTVINIKGNPINCSCYEVLERYKHILAPNPDEEC